MRLTPGYVVRRLLLFVLVVWAAGTINFIVPRLAPGDPTAAIIGRLESQGGRVENPAALIAEYRKTFGLDKPILVQYFLYLRNAVKLDFGFSIAFFPSRVSEVIARRLPWTVGLLASTVLISFVVGSVLGALMAWPRSARALRAATPVVMVLAAIPYYLMALILLWLLAFSFAVFPAFGTEKIGNVFGTFGFARIGEIIYYSTLPALSIVLASVGLWAVTMRGIMISTLGEDYLVLAEAKGLPPGRIFFWYGMRNALLPQVTGLAIALGHVVAGAVIVELLFSYPGVGHLLLVAITGNDYPVIQGITFFIVLSVAAAVLIVDLIYPRLDPRIKYGRR